MRTSEVMAVGIAKDADVTTTAHVNPREIRMPHLLHLLKIPTFSLHKMSITLPLYYLTSVWFAPGGSPPTNDIANLQKIFVSASVYVGFFAVVVSFFVYYIKRF